jgi:hypothetical protein
MGSSNSGRITDYPGSSGGGSGSEGAPGGGRKRDGGEDRCAKAFAVELEDIEHSEYYGAHSKAPPVGTTVFVELRKRIVAATSDNQSIGNLPTSRNYLAACLKAGWQYVGRVQAVQRDRTGIIISIDFAAQQN